MQSCQGSQGVTLVETLVATAIMGIVIYAALSFMEKSRVLSAINGAMIEAQQEASEIASILPKDVVFLNQQNPNAVSVTPTRLSLDTVSDTLIYQSSCMTAPTALAGLNFSGAAPGGCLPGGACGKGQVPTLTITRPGGQPVKTYPRILASKGGSSQSAVGTMACFSVQAKQISTALTHFYLGTNREVLALKRTVTVPFETGGVQLQR